MTTAARYNNITLQLQCVMQQQQYCRAFSSSHRTTVTDRARGALEATAHAVTPKKPTAGHERRHLCHFSHLPVQSLAPMGCIRYMLTRGGQERKEKKKKHVLPKSRFRLNATHHPKQQDRARKSQDSEILRFPSP